MHPQHPVRIMPLPRRELPIGIQSFAKIREGGYYYVDKTAMALSLAAGAGYYFLSRPRRFGKSLFLDTLKELFEGNEALFRGLHIHGKWDWATRFPVVRISFNDGRVENRADLDMRIRSNLQVNFERLGLPCPDLGDTIHAFAELIRRARARHGQRVVVLVDEYDKPILDNIDDRAATLAVRNGLQGFYAVIKGADEDIRLAMVTGVSKFCKVSLFSGLNNLDDITLDPAYSALCGYTDHDVDSVFAPELPGFDRDEIRRWYNGYNWRGEAVYNPFDLLRLFKRREFGAWWFETATPSFLVKLLADRRAWLPELGQLEADHKMLSEFDPDNISTTALMFQSGYLTIASEERGMNRSYFRLRIPNHEVSQSLYDCLLQTWTDAPGLALKNTILLPTLLAACDFAGLRTLFHAFFSSIPHQWHTNNHIADYEGYYASVFHAYFVAAGLDVRVEDATSVGRIDMAVRTAGRIWLFEFKVVESAPDGRALRQVKDRAYADKYRGEGLPIQLVGVEFSKESRNVAGFEVELAA